MWGVSQFHTHATSTLKGHAVDNSFKSKLQSVKDKMLTLLIAAFVAGFSLFIVWLLGFSQDEVKKIEDMAIKYNLLVVEEEEETEERETSSTSIKSVIDRELKEDFPYPQLWRYPAQSKANFRWPQEAATLVEIQKRREGATKLSLEMRLKLKGMGILREDTTEHHVTENIAQVARDTGILMPRKTCSSHLTLSHLRRDQGSCSLAKMKMFVSLR